jgi:DNA-binding transcriptional MerR regulator
MGDSLSQKQINQIFPHLSPRTILSWAKGGLLEWAEASEDGRGILRKYHLESVYQIAIIEELSSLNVPMEVIKFTLDRIKAEPGQISGNRQKFILVKKRKAGFCGWKVGARIHFHMLDKESLRAEIEDLRTIPGAVLISLNAVWCRTQKCLKVAGIKT